MKPSATTSSTFTEEEVTLEELPLSDGLPLFGATLRASKLGRQASYAMP